MTKLTDEESLLNLELDEVKSEIDIMLPRKRN
jgi:hypothetical protein